jgi:hypothetical protein
MKLLEMLFPAHWVTIHHSTTGIMVSNHQPSQLSHAIITFLLI